MTHKLAANISGIRVGETEYCRDCFDMLHQKNRHADEIFLKGEQSDWTMTCQRCSSVILPASILDKDEHFEDYNSKDDTCLYCVSEAGRGNGWHCHNCGYWNHPDNQQCHTCNSQLPRRSKQR